MTEPKISIVLPSLNQAKYIEKTILSVINQNYQNTELIIIDGGSEDETAGIIKKYEKHIAYWISEKDSGQSDALNKGFARATGSIFGWINSDDIYLPGTFRHAAEMFERYPDKTVLYGDWLSIRKDDRILRNNYAISVRTPRFPYENMESYNQSMFWRKEAHARFGRFDTELHRLMDIDLILALLINETPNRFIRSRRFLGAFRVHERQKTSAEKMDALHFAEEKKLELKYKFKPKESISGKWYRICYRFRQLFDSLLAGGFSYTLDKFRRGLKNRGGFL